MFNFNKYMIHAIKVAEKGKNLNSVPVGSLVVVNEKIISSAFNSEKMFYSEKKNSEKENSNAFDKVKFNKNNELFSFSKNEFIPGNIMHSELIAVIKATKILKKNSLENVTIFVTLEPCPMCAGMLSLLRVKKIIFGAYKNISQYYIDDHFFNFKPEVIGGVLEDECKELIKNFFKNLRDDNNL